MFTDPDDPTRRQLEPHASPDAGERCRIPSPQATMPPAPASTVNSDDGADRRRPSPQTSMSADIAESGGAGSSPTLRELHARWAALFDEIEAAEQHVDAIMV